MKQAILLAVLLIGAVQIHSVYYDPIEYQRGGEFIMLENTGPETINLSDWKIATTISQQDAILQGSISGFSTYLLGDEGWSEMRDNSSWPQADFEHRITLANAQGFVSVIDTEENIVDTVGWGDIDTYLKEPHPGVTKGYALMRVSHTQNNSADYQEAIPFTHIADTSTNNTVINITINNTPPELVEYEIEEINPSHIHINLSKEHVLVPVRVEIKDLNTVRNVTVFANEYELTTNQTGIQANYSAEIPIDAQTTQLTITYSDEEYSNQFSIPITFSERTSIHIPQGISLQTSPGGNGYVEVPITNTGTTTVDLHIQASLPSWASQAVGELKYSLAGANHSLSDDINIHTVGLESGEQILLQLEILAGYVPASEYLGELIISAVKQQ